MGHVQLWGKHGPASGLLIRAVVAPVSPKQLFVA
jgi:hypothetical protein